MKNKVIIISLLVAIITVVGISIAYFTNSIDIENIFETKPYGTKVDEEFESPDNWLPGTTTPKILTVTNTGEVDEAVRISFTETWTSKNAKNNEEEGDLALQQGDNKVALINFINPDDWTKEVENNKTYYYYNYKLSPNQTTSELLDSVTFNSAITNDYNCVESDTDTSKTMKCKSTGNGYDGATYKLTFNIETVQYDKYKTAWGTSVNIVEVRPEPEPEPEIEGVNGVEYLLENALNQSNDIYSDQTKKNMFAFTHGSGANAVTDYRYIGDDPNNYVYFNCTDDEDTSTCEVWRIIGTFDVERTDPTDSSKTITETRMKLVRGSDFATTMKWDDRVCETCGPCAYGKNDWEGSYMNTYLNGTYYNSLSETAKSQIEDAIYYLGGFAYNTSTSTEQIYEKERGTETCATTGNCSGGTRSTSWEGKVALMYPSDMYMTYAKTDGVGCYNQPMNYNVCGETNGAYSWIYNTNKLENGSSYQWTWLLSPGSSYASDVFNGDSSILSDDIGNSAGGVRPVVYLKSDIKIDGGTGEEGKPYVLK